MRSLYILILIAIISAIVPSCSCSKGGDDVPATDITEVSPEIADAAMAAADSVIALRHNETALNEKLLDLRASIYSLSTTRGDKAGKDFELVFRLYITEHCDSLARILF